MIEYIYKCNVCGKNIDKTKIRNHPMAYYSGEYYYRDCEEIRIDFCCDCFDNLIKSCKIYPSINKYAGGEVFNDNGDYADTYYDDNGNIVNGCNN